MKVLVIGDNVVAKALVQVLNLFTKAILASHDDGLAIFLTEEPTRVIVLDYDEYEGSGICGQGKQAWKDIKGSAGDEVILRCGFSSYAYEDYVKLPFELPELLEKLGITKEEEVKK